MTTDTERMNFLETLRSPIVFMTKDNPDYFLTRFFRTSGPDMCNITVFDHNGAMKWHSSGKSVREAIDDIICAMDHNQIFVRRS